MSSGVNFYMLNLKDNKRGKKINEYLTKVSKWRDNTKHIYLKKN